jgi:hypothetical protein
VGTGVRVGVGVGPKVGVGVTVAVGVGVAGAVEVAKGIKIWQDLMVPTSGSPKTELAHKTPFVYIPVYQEGSAPYLTKVVPLKLQVAFSTAQVVHVGTEVEVGVGVVMGVTVAVCPTFSAYNGLPILLNTLPIMGPRNIVGTAITRANIARRRAYSTNPCPFLWFIRSTDGTIKKSLLKVLRIYLIKWGWEVCGVQRRSQTSPCSPTY